MSQPKMAYPHGHVVGTMFRSAQIKHDATGAPFVDGALVTERAREFRAGEFKMTIQWRSYDPEVIRMVPMLRDGVRIRVEGDIDMTGFMDQRDQAHYSRLRITGTVQLVEPDEGGGK